MYAIIGAGPMGLASARNLQKLGIPFIGFELHSEVGGLWDIDNPHSTMYDSAHLISSKRMTEFAEFPMADEVAPYPITGRWAATSATTPRTSSCASITSSTPVCWS